jgi:hypothetical protein
MRAWGMVAFSRIDGTHTPHACTRTRTLTRPCVPTKPTHLRTQVVQEFKQITAAHPEWEKGYYKLAAYYEDLLENDQSRGVAGMGSDP